MNVSVIELFLISWMEVERICFNVINLQCHLKLELLIKRKQ